MCPIEAFTENSEPRYRSKVLALVGDSTITRFLAIGNAPLYPRRNGPVKSSVRDLNTLNPQFIPGEDESMVPLGADNTCW
jgi:hypothetical protein